MAFGATLAAVALRGLVVGDRRAWAYLVVLSCAGALVARVASRAALSVGVVRALAGLGVAHAVGGLLPAPGRPQTSFYETWLVDEVVKFDQAVHFAGTGVLTVAMAEVVGRWLDPARAGEGVRWFLAVLAANALGAWNEVFEFLSAKRFADLRVGGLDNAGWDLVFNLTGSVCVALVALAALGAGARTDRAANRSVVRGAWSADPRAG